MNIGEQRSKNESQNRAGTYLVPVDNLANSNIQLVRPGQ